MWQKITTFPLMAYLALSGFTSGLKKDERGLSGVVVTVLLILVAVLAVVLVWGFLSGWLAEMWEKITKASKELARD
ncbi:MAG: hypothetical protein FWF85_07865 [Clostridiales bacterium]|jgi:flagellin-like protein|nr:hypothetical protein [Clostridiales bacterium]MDR2713742.1 hypothetical protein [Clostridiales bacterium]